MGYVKQIAVIKGLKDGFSADGGALSGLIKCERYGSTLGADVSLINFAPLTEGRYVCALSDGKHTEIFENRRFEGESEVDISRGFGALICYVNSQVTAIASAICGTFAGSMAEIKREVEKSEKITPDESGQVAADADYRDDAIAEVNYYEYEQAAQSQGAVCAGEKQEDTGTDAHKNEEDISAKKKRRDVPFYKRVQSEVDNILKIYKRVPELEKIYENARWVRIEYGDEKCYFFGVLYEELTPQYFAYAIPAESDTPPENLIHLASFVPAADGKGYWVMYQNASTGTSVIVR